MSIELKPFLHEAEVAIDDGQILHLVLNFGTIDRLEALLSRGMDEILGELATSTSLMTKVLWAMTRQHHSELSFDQLAAVQFSKEHGQVLAAAVGDLIKRAFNFADVGEGEQSSRPPKRSRGASRSSSKSGALAA